MEEEFGTREERACAEVLARMVAEYAGVPASWRIDETGGGCTAAVITCAGREFVVTDMGMAPVNASVTVQLSEDYWDGDLACLCESADDVADTIAAWIRKGE